MRGAVPSVFASAGQVQAQKRKSRMQTYHIVIAQQCTVQLSHNGDFIHADTNEDDLLPAVPDLIIRVKVLQNAYALLWTYWPLGMRNCIPPAGRVARFSI